MQEYKVSYQYLIKHYITQEFQLLTLINPSRYFLFRNIRFLFLPGSNAAQLE